MTPQEKLVELAKIDGITGHDLVIQCERGNLKHYLRSSEILFLISTQPGTIIERITWLINHYERTYYKQHSYLIPAERLADYLLMAHGKMNEPDNMTS
jgi:hypothetical protein